MLLAIPVTTGDLLPTEGVLAYIEGLIHFLLLISAMERWGTYLMIPTNV